MVSKDKVSSALWAWNDLVWTLFMVSVIAYFLIAPIQKATTETTETARSAGNASVFIWWPDHVDVDIDTWLRSPDGDIVSFHRKSGTIWSLLRDDLGATNDTTAKNFENAYSRGLPPGEYTINAHVYRSFAKFPIIVGAELRIEREENTYSRVTFDARVTFDRVGEEATLFRFRIDERGNFVTGSMSNMFTPLAVEGK